jgi:serine/threonine-protein kinase
VLPSDDTLFADPMRQLPLQGEVRGYRIEGLLGRGALTTVFAAGRGGTRYALKHIPHEGQAVVVAAQVQQHLDLLRKLRHEHLVPVIDSFVIGPVTWIVSGVARGVSADRFADTTLGWELATQVGVRVAKALAYAWRFHGQPHLNLKPSNLFLDLRGGSLAAVAVSDLGLGRGATPLANDLIAGAPLFQAPELRTGDPGTASADFYGLGALLYFLLTGRPPAASEDGGAERLPGIPAMLADLLQRLLALDPSQRPATWEEVQTGLEACLNDNPFEGEGATPEPVPTDGPRRVTTQAHTTADPVSDWLYSRMRETGRVQRDDDHPATLAPGTVVAGVYTVRELLSTGRLIEHYAVDEAILNRALTLKIVTPEGMANRLLCERLISEGTLLNSIHHQAFPSVAGRGRWEGREYLAIERVTGGDLKTYLARKGAFNEGQALWVASGLVAAMEHGFETCRLVHRDLKPANLVVADGTERHLKIVDFSTALYLKPRDIHDFSTAAMSLIDDAGAGRAVGTPAYMSPEQIRGEGPSPQMDIYAIGGVLYHLMTGETPYRAPSALLMMQAHLEQPLPDLNQHAEVTPSTVALVARCLAKDPRERVANYKQLAQAIQAAGFATQAALRRKERGLTSVYTRSQTNPLNRSPRPGS